MGPPVIGRVTFEAPELAAANASPVDRGKAFAISKGATRSTGRSIQAAGPLQRFSWHKTDRTTNQLRRQDDHKWKYYQPEQKVTEYTYTSIAKNFVKGIQSAIRERRQAIYQKEVEDTLGREPKNHEEGNNTKREGTGVWMEDRGGQVSLTGSGRLPIGECSRASFVEEEGSRHKEGGERSGLGAEGGCADKEYMRD